MHAEEGENAYEQPGHEDPDNVDGVMVVGIGRVDVRLERDEVLVHVVVALAARLDQVVGMHARARVRRRQILVRRVAVRADGALRHAEARRLAVETVAERGQVLVVAAAAVIGGLDPALGCGGIDDLVGRVAVYADRSFLVFRPDHAVRARILPVVEQQFVAGAAHLG